MKPFHLKVFSSLVLVCVLMTLAGPATAHAVFVLCYVKPHAGALHDGTSWANAYLDLQAALGGSCSEIWVAAGTYKPTGLTDRTISFNIPAGTAIYGGFAGTETLRTQRDPVAHVTKLSGDIGTVEVNTDNSYHVVMIDGTSAPVTSATVLDGFTITGGNANGLLPAESGGGLYCNGGGPLHQCSPTLQNLIFSSNSAANRGGAIFNLGSPSGASSPTLVNVTFSGNSAIAGGAIYNNGENIGISSPTLTNVSFTGNTATGGGAIYNDGESSGASNPSLSNVIFSSNTATTSGGAIYNDGSYSGASNPSIMNTAFSGNSAATSGGAIYNNGFNGTSNSNLTKVTFSGNSAADGGAIYNDGESSGHSNPSLTNVTFSGNIATSDGGAIYNNGETSGSSNPSLTYVTFSDNSAAARGGAIYNLANGGTSSPWLTNVTFSANSASAGGAVYDDGYAGTSSPTLTNVTFSGNSAVTGAGGAIYNDGSFSGTSSPSLTNVTFGGNSALGDGGAIYGNGHSGTSSPILTNVILWGNTTSTSGSEVYNSETDPALSYTVVEGGCPSGSSCTNTITTDPKLGPLQNNGGSTQTMALGAGSSAIDIGKTASCPATDQRGVARLLDGACDVGAYELVPPINLALSSSSVAENQPAGTTVGTLSTIDADPSASVTYALVSGAGSTDNASFSVSGATLKTAASFNYLYRTNYSIRLRTTDEQGQYFEKAFTISIISLPPTFTDVPESYWAASWIERLYNAGITGGCFPSPLSYCPGSNVTRDEMAVFLEKGLHGSSFNPPTVPLTFTDTSADFAKYWIEALKSDGITSGCGGGMYCPYANVTRAQMAVFLLKAEHGSAYLPPAATGTLFTDVPISYWAAPSIEQLYHEGMTGGCTVTPLSYCPDSNVTRDQMAVFLVKVFHLP